MIKSSVNSLDQLRTMSLEDLVALTDEPILSRLAELRRWEQEAEKKLRQAEADADQMEAWVIYTLYNTGNAGKNDAERRANETYLRTSDPNILAVREKVTRARNEVEAIRTELEIAKDRFQYLLTKSRLATAFLSALAVGMDPAVDAALQMRLKLNGDITPAAYAAAVKWIEEAQQYFDEQRAETEMGAQFNQEMETIERERDEAEPVAGSDEAFLRETREELIRDLYG